MADTVLPQTVRANQPQPADGAHYTGVLMPTTLRGRVVAAPIVAYRRWISPALPPTCRFYPSCSEYALTAVAVHGPLKGIGLAIWRLLRCQPFNRGGLDYVPPRREHTHHPAPLDTMHREQ
jgi:putative membrane protein insertion efficiency factor